MKLFTSVLVISFLLSACSSTNITSTWKTTEASPAKFKRLVVIGLVGENEKKARELMEKHIVDDLKSLGYNALCSCEEYNPDFFNGMTEKEAIEKMKDKGIDGILTIVLLDKKKENIFVEGRAVNVPKFWDYYQTVNDRIYTKGYYTENTKYFWESNLYDLTGNQLLYSIQSQTFEPESTEKLAHEYGKKIVRKMIKQDILVKQTGK